MTTTRTFGHRAMLAASSLLALGFASTANAADLGGDCCADLEERVAELEATVARKGTRKVSLTVSGWVNEMVMWWDDGFESNTYVVTNQTVSTRFRFTGSAKINEDWSAGYLLEIEALGAGSSTVNQLTDDGAAALTPTIRHSHWWIQSKRLGKLAVGQNSFATDDLILADSAGCAPGCETNSANLMGGFFLRGTNGVLSGVTTGRLITNLDTDRGNVVRYDSPTFAGAKIVAAWGEDDIWDVAIWYASEFNGVKIVGGIGYLDVREQFPGPNGPHFTRIKPVDFHSIKASLGVHHIPSGLFVDAAYVQHEYENNDPDTKFYYVRGGVALKALPLGKTVLYGEYGKIENGLNNTVVADALFGIDLITDTEVTHYGLGLVQHVDAAAMQLYVTWKHFDFDVQTLLGGNVAIENFDMVYAGARIAF